MIRKIHLIIISLAFIFFGINITNAQVGIGTTTPQAGSILDIDIADKGILLPRVSLTALNSIAPITGGGTESLLIYNTNPTVGRGFHYWNGSVWIPILAKDWKQGGNVGTNPSTDFLGTIDNTSIRIRTNNTERLEISNSGMFRAFASGSAANPLFSWSGDTDKGFYSTGADQFGIATNGIQRLNITNTELVANDPGNDVNLRVETGSNENALFIDGGLNSIGVGTATPNGIFDMTSTTMGMVLPRVSLTSTIVAAPVVNPQGGALANGTCVYNINTAGSPPNNVAPGLYFWNGTNWVAFAGSHGGLDWTLTGNSGTVPGTNFLGTTDAVPLVLSTNSSPRMIVNPGTGEVYVNNPGYFANYMFQSSSIGSQTAIGGFGSGSEETYYGQSTGGAPVGLFLGANGGDGFRSMSNSASGNGVQGTGGSFTSYSYPGTSSGGVFAGTYGASGIGLSPTGTGLAGLGQGRLTIVVDPNGSGIAGSGDGLGVFGYAGYGDVTSGNRGNAGGEFILDADNDVTTTSGNDGTRARAKLAGFDNVTPDGSQNNRDSYYGGYFSGGSESSGTPSYAYVGMRYRTNANGDGVAGGGQDYKVIGTGTNSTLIDGPDGKPRIMFSPEAPEILFQDFGVGQLQNGMARIEIDPVLKGSIYVDRQHPLKVYVTLEGDCNGVFVTDKSGDGFTVKELQGGTSNAAFSWQIVASRADRIASNGTMISQHVGVRLPQGPGPLEQKEYKTESLKEEGDYKIDDSTIKPEMGQVRSNNTERHIPIPSPTANPNQKKN